MSENEKKEGEELTPKDVEDLEAEGTAIANFIRKLVRASEGYPPVDPQIRNMIKEDDIRERTILSKRRAEAHTYMRAVYFWYDSNILKIHPELTEPQRDAINPFELFKYLADSNDSYGISIDGRGRDYAVAFEKASNQSQIITNETQVPSFSQQSEKKHWWQKNKQPEKTVSERSIQ